MTGSTAYRFTCAPLSALEVSFRRDHRAGVEKPGRSPSSSNISGAKAV